MMPATGVVAVGTVSQVVDGDTIKVRFTREVAIRIADCWAPEKKRTDHHSEKPRGIAARDAMELLADGERVRVVVRTDGDEDFGDSLTFGRVVADVYRESDGKNLAKGMIQKGHAFRTKAELEAFPEQKDAEQ